MSFQPPEGAGSRAEAEGSGDEGGDTGKKTYEENAQVEPRARWRHVAGEKVRKGVDLVVDPVGGATLQGSLGALGYRGRISLVGNAGREPMKVDVSSLMGGNRSLTGVFLGAEIMTDRVHDMIQDLIDQAARGELEVVIDSTFPLAEADKAHAYIEGRQAVGRVLLIP